MSEPKSVQDAAVDDALHPISPGGTYGDSGDDRPARRSEVRTTPDDGAVSPAAPVTPPVD